MIRNRQAAGTFPCACRFHTRRVTYSPPIPNPETERNEVKVSRSLLIVGAIILLLGLAGIAIPYFTTEQTKDVADVGPLHVHATEQQSHSIPPLLSEGAVVVGVVLMGVGLFRRA
jgi:hypothetical protein